MAKLHAFNRATALADEQATEDLDPTFWNNLEPDSKEKHQQDDAMSTIQTKTTGEIPKLEISDMSIDDGDFKNEIWARRYLTDSLAPKIDKNYLERVISDFTLAHLLFLIDLQI